MKSLADLRTAIEAQIQAEGATAAVVFGRKHLVRRDNQGTGTANRVVIAPGQPEGEWVSIAPATKIHRAYPALHDQREWVTVQVWGYDATDPSSDEKQYLALRGLWQTVTRAIHLAINRGGHKSGFYELGGQLMQVPVDRRHGEMAQCTFWIEFANRQPMPDEIKSPAEPNLNVAFE